MKVCKVKRLSLNPIRMIYSMAFFMTFVNFVIIGILLFCWTSVTGPARIVIVALVLSLLGNMYGWHFGY